MFDFENCNEFSFQTSFGCTLFLSGELRDAVKIGDYMSVKLALNSKEDYNLDQEVRHVNGTCRFSTLVFKPFLFCLVCILENAYFCTSGAISQHVNIARRTLAAPVCVFVDGCAQNWTLSMTSLRQRCVFHKRTNKMTPPRWDPLHYKEVNWHCTNILWKWLKIFDINNCGP